MLDISQSLEDALRPLHEFDKQWEQYNFEVHRGVYNAVINNEEPNWDKIRAVASEKIWPAPDPSLKDFI